MRKFVMAAALIAGVQGAQAADMPDYPLRGGYSDIGPTRPLWDGLYIGGQAAESWVNIKPPSNINNDIETAFSARTALVPSSIAAQPRAEGRSTAYGGFVGYNTQWTDVVVGIEGNYLHSNMLANSIANSPVTDAIRGQSTVALALKDFGSLRVRAGYMMGSFLPYAFAGFGAGAADITRTAGVTFVSGVPSTFPFEISTERNRMVTGYAVGAGVDVKLIGGLFARIEYEYLRFTSRVDTTVNTVRAGLGYQF